MSETEMIAAWLGGMIGLSIGLIIGYLLLHREMKTLRRRGRYFAGLAMYTEIANQKLQAPIHRDTIMVKDENNE